MLGLSLIVLADLAPQAMAAAVEPQTAAIAPGMARVWFLRPAGSLNGNVWAAAPMIYANGAPIGDIPAGSEFYRDFRPGAYSFTVEPYGLRTGHADTVQLAPGTQTYLEIQWIASWEQGYPEGRTRPRLGFHTQHLRHPDVVASAGAGLSSDIDLSPAIGNRYEAAD